MNEKQVLSNILSLSKTLIILYAYAEIESSNRNMKDLFNDCLNKSLALQFKLYKNMEKNNYYQNKKLDKQEINSTYQKLKMTYC